MHLPGPFLVKVNNSILNEIGFAYPMTVSSLGLITTSIFSTCGHKHHIAPHTCTCNHGHSSRGACTVPATKK